MANSPEVDAARNEYNKEKTLLSNLEQEFYNRYGNIAQELSTAQSNAARNTGQSKYYLPSGSKD